MLMISGTGWRRWTLFTGRTWCTTLLFRPSSKLNRFGTGRNVTFLQIEGYEMVRRPIGNCIGCVGSSNYMQELRRMAKGDRHSTVVILGWARLVGIPGCFFKRSRRI